MKIVGFTQHRNEALKENLLNWLKCMDMCEYIYVYDQGSNDKISLSILESNPKIKLIKSETNNFVNENLCKKELLEKLLFEHPDTDWIVWADVDYFFSNNILKDNFKGFFDLCRQADEEGVEGLAFGHYNLYRSDIYYRTDQYYHANHEGGRVTVWKNNGKLRMSGQAGLHKNPLPDGIGKIKRVDCSLIHRGFATDEQIISKYRLYGSLGQRGWELDRLIDESTLAVEKLPEGTLPEWFKVQDNLHPAYKRRLREIIMEHNQKNLRRFITKVLTNETPAQLAVALSEKIKRTIEVSDFSIIGQTTSGFIPPNGKLPDDYLNIATFRANISDLEIKEINRTRWIVAQS